MKKKIYKLFGVKIFEITNYPNESEFPIPKKLFGKPKGVMLEYSPEEAQRDKDKETLRKMEGK